MNENFINWLDERITQVLAAISVALDDIADPHATALETARLAELARVRAEASDYGA